MFSTTDVQLIRQERRQSALSIMLLSLLLGIGALCQPLVWVGGEDSILFYAVEFFGVMAFIMLSTLWIDRSLITPYFFILSTTMIFIGGRFIAFPFIDEPVFSDSNFALVVLSSEEASNLLSKVLGGLLMAHVGYCFVAWTDIKGSLRLPAQQALPDFTLPALVLLLLSSAISIYGIVEHYAACSQLGYMSIYQDQRSDNLTRLASLGQYGLLLGTGLAFATPRKWLHVLAFSLVVGYFMAYLGLGLRSGFLALMLMALWLVHTRLKRLNIFTILLVPVLMIALAQLSITVGCRAQSIATADSVKETKKIASARVDNAEGVFEQFKERLRLEELAWFSYLQGSTLTYSGAAMRLEHYPTVAYFQSFLPGFSQLYGRMHPEIPVSDYYFPHYLAKSYSEEKYNQGFGIGWSLYSDFYVLSGGNAVGYGLVAVVFGALLAYFVRAANSSAFVLGALVCVFLKLMLLPRSGIYSVFPYLVAYSLLYWSIRFVYRITPLPLRRAIYWR